MNVFVARQPIFDREKNIYAYELLYRKSMDNFFPDMDGDQATSELIINSALVIGIQNIVQGKKAFVNFPENLIKDEIPTMLSNDLVVIEILEHIEPTSEMIACCTRLKQAGYTIALDDFIFTPEYEPLIALADIIKIDFLNTSIEERKDVVTRIQQKYNIEFLAEKVETEEDYAMAIEFGYTYFQGYFFSKPSIMSGKAIPNYTYNNLGILRELNSTEPCMEQLSKLIQSNLSLSYQLLRMINSPIFCLRQRVDSIHQAIVLLGLKEISKWLSLIIVCGMGQDKPDALVRTAILRGKFAELLAEELGMASQKQLLFMMGMFSMVDALTNLPLEEALQTISLDEKIANALLGRLSVYRTILDLILSYEIADWEQVTEYAKELNLREHKLPALYYQAIELTNGVLSPECL